MTPFRKTLLAALAAASFASLPGVGFAQRAVIIDQPPPPAREERMPAPRRGMEWAPGHWEWRNGQHVWMRGHWMKARHGQHWAPDEWREVNGRWQHRPGRWMRGDRDGDGVPNRLDSRPNNPNRN